MVTLARAAEQIGAIVGSLAVAASPERIAQRVRSICAGLQDVTERPSHGAPTWFVRDRRSFVQCWPSGHHDAAFPHLWCAAPPGAAAALVAGDPSVFFRPPYVGGRGWVGMRLDGAVDWDLVASVCEDAYRLVEAVTPGRGRRS